MRRQLPPPPVEDLGASDRLLDDVIQRLFATGVGLHAIVPLVQDPELAARLARHVAELDDTIEEIRTRLLGVANGAGAG
jgi:signal transduction histidine kinase